MFSSKMNIPAALFASISGMLGTVALIFYAKSDEPPPKQSKDTVKIQNITNFTSVLKSFYCQGISNFLNVKVVVNKFWFSENLRGNSESGNFVEKMIRE